MKSILLMTVMCLFALHGKSQYAGGSGGGYASTTWTSAGSNQQLSMTWGANPSDSKSGLTWQATMPENALRFQVWDVLGRQIDDFRITGNGSTISGTWGKGLASGLYLIQVESGGQSVLRKQILINQ